jgi:hypothetical protein
MAPDGVRNLKRSGEGRAHHTIVRMPTPELLLLVLVCALGAGSAVPWVFEIIRRWRSDDNAQEEQRCAHEEGDSADQEQELPSRLISKN